MNLKQTIFLALSGCTTVLGSNEHGVCGVDAPPDTPPDVAPDAPRPCHLIAVTGQSNVHHGGRASELMGTDTQYATPFAAVKQIARLASINDGLSPPSWTEYSLSPTQPRDFRGTLGEFGAELTLARDLAAARPNEDWIIVEESVGGTTLYDHWAPTWTLFADVHNYLDTKIAETGCPLAAYEWNQGGSDAMQVSRANAYGAKLTGYKSAINARYPGVPFVYDRLPSATVAPYLAQVRTGEEALVGGVMINDDAAVLRSDGIHWNTPSALAIGHLHSAAILNAVP